MSSEQIPDPLAEVVEAQLAYLDGEGPAPSLDGLPPELRGEARERLALLDAVWDAGIDDLSSDDPVARRFGFDRPGRAISLNGRLVAQLRRGGGRDLAAFLEAVNTAGGATTGHVLFQLEQSDQASVPQPLATAIVAVLGVDLRDIEAAMEGGTNAVQAYLDSAEFDQLVAEWAAEHARSSEAVGAEVGRQLVGAYFRAEDVSREQLREAVLAILRSLEP